MDASSRDRIPLSPLLAWAIKGSGDPPAPEDWAALLDDARAQKVHLFLYPLLRATGCGLPPPLLAGLRTEYLAAAVTAERIRDQIAGLLDLFQGAGIPVIPLKGAWLAEHAYAEPAQRFMHDLDLLIRKEDEEKAAAVLIRLDYRPFGPGDGKHRVFHPARGLPLELHTRLDHAGPLSLDPEPLWRRAVPARCAGQPCLALAPADLVLVLARHALLHSLAFYPLRSLLDIALVLKKQGPAVDLFALHRQAEPLRMVRGLAVILALAGELAGLEREAEWPENWKPDPLLLEEARTLVWEHGGDRQNPPEPLHRLREARSWRRRLSLLAERLFLPPDELKKAYPWSVRRGRRPFALLARAISLARLYGRALLRLLRGDPSLMQALDLFRERRGWLDRVYPD